MKMERIMLEEAQKIVCDHAALLETEKIPLLNGVGRILAEDLIAKISQPPFQRSAMDGYAVRSHDLKNGLPNSPVQLQVVYKVCAGDFVEEGVGEKQAVRIMTGAMIPDGTDCVIPQEHTDYGEEHVIIYRSAEAGENCCPIGEDFSAGEILASAGTKIDAYLAATAAAAGQEFLVVYKKPKIALLTTGNELRKPGENLLPGQIYDSSGVYLNARLRELGCEILECTVISDCLDEITKALEEVCENADFVITTGGVSVGEKDFLPEVLERLGGQILFHGIQLKPGMPTMYSLLEDTPILSLSGNPYSAAAVFELLVQPWLAVSRNYAVSLIEKNAVMANEYPKKSPRRRILRGKYDGKEVYVSSQQKNGQMKAGIGTNCLVDIPAGNDKIKQGDIVKILMV